MVARNDDVRQALAALNDRAEFHSVYLASFVTIGKGTGLANVMTPTAVFAGVSASVLTARDG
jgi:hypothetical protein